MSRTEERRELWGGETAKAIANFPVSGEPIPPPVARWLGRIKGAAAQANADLGLLDRDKADRIAAAAERIANGELDDQFPIDVFQTGSGTSSNMNANEVIAALAGEDVHANDDVNMGQSSNDVFPSAVHLAALDRVVTDLLPALDQPARRPVRVAGGARRARGGVGRTEGGRRLAHEDRERPPLPRLRAARRPRRDLPAGAAEGLVDHAGQGEPGDPGGRDAGRRAGDRQRPGDRDRRHAGPLR